MAVSLKECCPTAVHYSTILAVRNVVPTHDFHHLWVIVYDRAEHEAISDLQIRGQAVLICQAHGFDLVSNVFFRQLFQEGFELLRVILYVKSLGHTVEEIFSVAAQLVIIPVHDRRTDGSAIDFLIEAVIRGYIKFLALLGGFLCNNALISLLLLDALLFFLQQCQLDDLLILF